MRYIKDLTLYKEAAERIENICLTLRYTGAAKFFAQYRKVCYTNMETVFILRGNFCLVTTGCEYPLDIKIYGLIFVSGARKRIYAERGYIL